MSEQTFVIIYKLRFLLGSVLIVISLLLLTFILSVTSDNSVVHAKSNNPALDNGAVTPEDNPNIIADGMDTGVTALARVSSSADKTLNNSVRGVSSSVLWVAGSGSKIAAHSIRSSVIFTAHGMTKSFAFMIHAPGSVLGHIPSPPSVGSIITPAESDQSPVPTITPIKKTASSLGTTQPTIKSLNQSVTPKESTAIWPLHGIITTQFGVPELPYQAIHTGLDISDGKPSGTTPIKPFKPGRVIGVIHSGGGLGNHIIIDHDGGVTSVYGHLYSVSVSVGQSVDQGTTLGYEGSTGASTGTHLHFEIRVNNQPVNPHQFITGQP